MLKNKNWKQTNPKDQHIAILSSIVGTISNIQEDTLGDMLIQKQISNMTSKLEQLSKLSEGWMKNSWND